MPLYEYQCGRCGRFEVIRKFSDAPLTACPTCGQDVQKLFSAPAIQFKGTGWYITDYARKSSSGEATNDGGAGKSAAAQDGGASKDGGQEKAGTGTSASTGSSATETSSSIATETSSSGAAKSGSS